MAPHLAILIGALVFLVIVGAVGWWQAFSERIARRKAEAELAKLRDRGEEDSFLRVSLYPVGMMEYQDKIVRAATISRDDDLIMRSGKGNITAVFARGTWRCVEVIYKTSEAKPEKENQNAESNVPSPQAERRGDSESDKAG